MEESEYIRQLNRLLDEEDAAGRTQELVKRAFELNNHRFKQEKKHWCGGCVNRVFRNLRSYAGRIRE